LIYGKYGRNVKESTSGGSVVGGEKVWSLAFGDDLVIVVKSDREIREMKKNLGKYVRKKKLEVNAEKTKMMVVSKRKRKSGNKKDNRTWWSQEDNDDVRSIIESMYGAEIWG
jgi:ribosome-interacting GTPase 1